jgi:hypothetical protein
MKGLTVAQAARRMKISIDATQKLCQAGKILASKHQGRWVISKASVEERIAERNHR